MKKLEIKEKDLMAREKKLNAYERDADVKMKSLEKKEMDLLAIEQRLNAQIKDADVKMKSFEKKEVYLLATEQRLNAQVKDVEVMKMSLETKEKDLLATEERLKAQVKDTDVEMKETDLLAKEERLNAQDTDVKMKSLEMKEMDLVAIEEKLKAQEIQKLIDDYNVRLCAQRKGQHKLKEEIEYWMMNGLSVLRENDLLKERVKEFERDQGMLDEKRMALKKFDDEKEMFEMWLHNKLKGLKNAGTDAQELEDLTLAKEAFRKILSQQFVARIKDPQHVDHESAKVSRYAEPLLAYSSKKRHHPETVSTEVKIVTEHKQSITHAEDSNQIAGESNGASLYADPLVPHSRKKSNQAENTSTESLHLGESFPRQQIRESSFQTPQVKSYNLRSCINRAGNAYNATKNCDFC